MIEYPEGAIKVLDHGFVRLVDKMGDDGSIVEAARVSYGKGTKKVSTDTGLIRYLMRHRHTTPFEMTEFKFHCRMPIFVARQWIRHRTASVNEISARYSEMEDLFYSPETNDCTIQSNKNRQGGSDQLVATAKDIPDAVKIQNKLCYAVYKALLDVGVRRELARVVLPESVYTSWYWKIDGKNLLDFLRLRLDPHAQQEIRVYAKAMLDLVTPIIPITIQAWKDYQFESLTLSRLELDSIRNTLKNGSVEQINSDNKRERAEWEAKVHKLGLTIR